LRLNHLEVREWLSNEIQERFMKFTCKNCLVPLLASLLLASVAPLAAQEQLVSGLQGASGSTIGPDGAIYVTEGAAGRLTRVDPWSGDTTTYATGLPPSLIGIGGAVDVSFVDEVAYVLVTLVDFEVGGADPSGIYRMDSPESFSLVADISGYVLSHPPATDYFLPTGVQYAMEPFRGGLLVTDGHHNRMYWIRLDGTVTEFNVFGNIVPTGLAVHGKTVYMAEAGPTPHDPETGRVVAFEPKSLTPVVIASGAPLLVDVEFGLGRTLYALAQGEWSGQFGGDGSPADPFTGSLVEVNEDGTFKVLAEGLNQPTSMEFIGNTAYIVTLSGDILKLDNVSSPPYGRGRRH
jgi:hypothetical protein